MKINSLALSITLFLITSVGMAQDYTFKVLANKGANEVKSGETWAPLRTGASLKNGDEVKLADNAYMGLVHVSGKPVEVKVAGIHKVSDLIPKAGGSSVLNKYTDFILSSNSAEAKKNKLSATGAVSRDVSAKAPAIQLFLPENQHSGIFNNVAVINWDGTNVAGPYVVIIRNMFEEELAQTETPETTFQVDLSDPKFTGVDALIVEVKSKNDPKQVSKRHLIKRLSSGEQEIIKTELNEILGEVSEPTALNKYILAGFYEEKNLFIDAIAAYEDAIKLAPDVQFYKDALDDFFLRHGMRKL